MLTIHNAGHRVGIGGTLRLGVAAEPRRSTRLKTGPRAALLPLTAHTSHCVPMLHQRALDSLDDIGSDTESE